MKLIQKKQIEGLVANLDTLFGNVNAISVGQPTLVGTSLSIPFTNKDGVITSKTVDLASLAVDVQVASATIDANTYTITVTETNGDVNTIPLAQILANYITANVTPAIQAADAKAVTAQATATTAQATAVSAQNSANAAQQSANTAQAEAANALQVAQQADAKAVTADTKAVAADAKAVAADTKATTALTAAQAAQLTANTVKDKKLDAIGFWSKKTIASTVNSGLLEISSSSAPLDNTNCVSFVTVNGVTHPVVKDVAEPFFLSADNGATAVATFQTAGTKLFCNLSALPYALEAGDEVQIFAGISLPRIGVAY